MAFGFGAAPALFAITYLVVAELTTNSQPGANLSIANAVLTTGGTTPADRYRVAFALAGGLMLTFGLLALLFVNQQRDRRRLGLDVAAGFTLETPAPAGSARGALAEPASLEAVSKA